MQRHQMQQCDLLCLPEPPVLHILLAPTTAFFPSLPLFSLFIIAIVDCKLFLQYNLFLLFSNVPA